MILRKQVADSWKNHRKMKEKALFDTNSDMASQAIQIPNIGIDSQINPKIPFQKSEKEI